MSCFLNALPARVGESTHAGVAGNGNMEERGQRGGGSRSHLQVKKKREKGSFKVLREKTDW